MSVERRGNSGDALFSLLNLAKCINMQSMSSEPQTPAPASVPSANPPVSPGAKLPVKRKHWTPAAPAQSKFSVALVLAVAAAAAILLVASLHFLLAPSGPSKPALDKEFRDAFNQSDFAFNPPRYWKIDDRTEKYTYYVKGPRETGFSPLMIFTSVSAPGQLAAFVDEHKKRMVAMEDPSVRFISDEDDSIDGCRAKRIEYESDYKESENAPVIKIHTLQFIVKDPSYPVFYKITCHSKRESFFEFLPIFSASAHSFRRVEVKVPGDWLLPKP